MKIKWFALTTLALIFGLLVGVNHFSISASAYSSQTSYSLYSDTSFKMSENFDYIAFVLYEGSYLPVAITDDYGTFIYMYCPNMYFMQKNTNYSLDNGKCVYIGSWSPSNFSSSLSHIPVFYSIDSFLTGYDVSVITVEDFNFINPRLFGGRTSAYTLTSVNFYASDTLSNGDTLSGIAYYFGTDLSSSAFTTTTGNFLHLAFPTSTNNVYLYVVPINSDGVYGNGIKYTFNTSSENISATGTHISVSDTDYPVCTTTTVTTDGFEYTSPDTSTSSGTTELNNIIDIPSGEELAETLISTISTILNASQSSDITDSDYDVPNSIDSPYDYNITCSDNVTITETDIDDLGLTDTMQDFSDGLTSVIQNDIFRPYFQLLGINTFNAWPIYLGLPSFFLILLVLKIFIFR